MEWEEELRSGAWSLEGRRGIINRDNGGWAGGHIESLKGASNRLTIRKCACTLRLKLGSRHGEGGDRTEVLFLV